MKWKILLRFLLIIVLSVIIAININIFIVYRFFFTDHDSGREWSQLGKFSLSFNQYILEEGGSPKVTEEGIEQLKQRGAWIQILDKEGYEVFSWNKPEQALEHYTPSQMVYYNIYSGAIDDYTTFAGTAEINNYSWSYIIGFPIERIAKYLFIYSPASIKTIILEVLVYLFIVPIIVLIVMGYAFGRNLTNPLIEIINGIGILSQGNYGVRYNEKGLYKEVYKSLNNLSDTLKRNELERKDMEKMREEWIQNLSHDLKTPLASIKGYGELMADEEYLLSQEEIREYSRIIKDKAEYMEELIEDLKFTHVLKKGLIPIRLKENNLTELIREITIDLLNNPHYQDRSISFNPKVEKILFEFDKALLQRAFTNLIYNSLVHNDEDTHISITMEKKDKIYVYIEDNGKGIAKEDLKNLFKKYYRGTNTGESHKGSGLGMAIAKQIIEVHGGQIEVESKLGKGTKISVIF